MRIKGLIPQIKIVSATDSAYMTSRLQNASADYGQAERVQQIPIAALLSVPKAPTRSRPFRERDLWGGTE